MFARRLAVIASAAVLVLAACADSADEQAAPPAEGEPVRGGILVAAIDTDPGSFNPAITTSGATHTASELMYNGLVELGDNLEPQPELAESWDIENNGALYRFHLRDGVKWHDGQPFTSADVKFTFEELLPLHSRTKASVLAALESIDTPNDRTVEFRFNEPYAPLLLQLNVTEAPILPRHVYQGTDPQTNPANLKPVGTGPFMFKSYAPDSQIELAANENYFKADQPYLDGVVMRVIPDKGNQVVALESGEVDWLFGVPGPDLARLRDSGGFDFLTTGINPGGSNCIMTVSFNLDRPMFADVRLRRAIGQALDRQQFLERVQFGQGRVAEAPISSGIPFAHAESLQGMPTFDRAAAAQLLDQAGWRQDGNGTRVAAGVPGVADGTALAFDFLVFPTFASYGELFRAQLAEVGAEVRVRQLEPPVFADTVFSDRDFDTNIISYCNGADPEIGVKRMYVSSSIGPVPFSNAAGYRNPDADRLFDQARITVDGDTRTKTYRQIQEQLVRDLPYLWIVETDSVRAFSRTCSGFSPSGHFAEAASCKQ